MRTPPLLLLLGSASLALGGVAPAHAGGLPVCSAKHKRPANLYGSVLSTGLKPKLADAAPKPGTAAAGLATTPGSAAAAKAASTKPEQVSRAELKASLASCGEPA